MILPCTSPPDTPFTQIWKARKSAWQRFGWW